MILCVKHFFLKIVCCVKLLSLSIESIHLWIVLSRGGGKFGKLFSLLSLNDPRLVFAVTLHFCMLKNILWYSRIDS